MEICYGDKEGKEGKCNETHNRSLLLCVLLEYRNWCMALKHTLLFIDIYLFLFHFLRLHDHSKYQTLLRLRCFNRGHLFDITQIIKFHLPENSSTLTIYIASNLLKVRRILHLKILWKKRFLRLKKGVKVFLFFVLFCFLFVCLFVCLLVCLFVCLFVFVLFCFVFFVLWWA